jgi:hypothetical protein
VTKFGFQYCMELRVLCHFACQHNINIMSLIRLQVSRYIYLRRWESNPNSFAPLGTDLWSSYFYNASKKVAARTVFLFIVYLYPIYEVVGFTSDDSLAYNDFVKSRFQSWRSNKQYRQKAWQYGLTFNQYCCIILLSRKMKLNSIHSGPSH